MDFAISKGINFIDMYASNPDLRSNIGKALTGRREQFIIQGHLCTTWENDQYLRTRDIDKAIASFEDQLARLDTDYLDIGLHRVSACRRQMSGLRTSVRTCKRRGIFLQNEQICGQTDRLHQHTSGFHSAGVS